MRTTTLFMKNLTPAIPGIEYGAKMKDTQDIILKSTLVEELKVAKMQLDIAGFSVIAEDGAEYSVSDFPGQRYVTIFGDHTNRFIRTHCEVPLPPARYNRLRFYLEPEGGAFIFDDYCHKDLRGIDYLDFDIQDGLTIKDGQYPDLILRFKLTKFRENGDFRSLKNILDWGNGNRLLTKLSNI